jgi:hypothetical protein
VGVTEHRTKVDWAHQIKELVDLRYPEAEQMVLVMDNLNTHSPASLYEAFDPSEARRLAEKLEVHYTPKTRFVAEHGRDRVECPKPTMPRSARAWLERRDEEGGKIEWRFRTDDARLKLKRLYPSLQE